jgi:hypothetical protein
MQPSFLEAWNLLVLKTKLVEFASPLRSAQQNLHLRFCLLHHDVPQAMRKHFIFFVVTRSGHLIAQHYSVKLNGKAAK